METIARLILLYFILLLYSFTLQVKGQSWIKNYGGSNFEYGKAIALDTDGQIYMLGNYQDTVSIDTFTSIPLSAPDPTWHFILSSHSPNGELEMIIESKGECEGRDLFVDKQRNIYITGFYIDSLVIDTLTIVGNSEMHYFLAKINPFGKLVWLNEVENLLNPGGFSGSSGNIVRVDNNGSVYSVIECLGPIAIGSDTIFGGNPYQVIVKYDSLGTILWARKEKVELLEIDNQGNYIVGADGFYIKKYNDLGNELWASHFSCSFRTMTIDKSGNIYTYDALGPKLIKYASADGDTVWSTIMNSMSPEQIAVDTMGNVIVSIEFIDTIHYQRAIIAKYNASGTFVGNAVLGNRIDPIKDNILFSFDLLLDDNGFIYLTGQWGTMDSTYTSAIFVGDTAISKGAYDAILIKGSSNLLINRIPSRSSTSRLSCFPNPFNGRLNIECDLEFVHLSITDVTGCLLHASTPHRNKTSINLTGLKPGVYILTVETNAGVFHRKLVKCH